MLSLNKMLWSFKKAAQKLGGGGWWRWVVEAGGRGWPNYLSCCDGEWLDLSDSDPRLQSSS